MARAAENGDHLVRVAVRGGQMPLPTGVEALRVGELAPETDWAEAVKGVDVVVHAAARVHLLRDTAADPLAEFRRTNVAGTMRLALQAAAAGARRFVFISSVKVHGELTQPGQPFTAEDVPAPADSYAISKCEAEEGLRQVANKTGLEVVVIRPVLVYGPGVKANFRTVLWWVHQGIPLPLGALHNLRSFVALDNLVDLILTCVRHPAAAGRAFLVSDGEDLSTTLLLRRVAAALGTRPRLIPVSATVLCSVARLMNKADIAQRLCASLQVDIRKTRELLGWAPPVGMDDALKQMAKRFIASLDA